MRISCPRIDDRQAGSFKGRRVARDVLDCQSIQQHRETARLYVLTNPFAGIKVRGAARTNVMETHHVFTEGEWALIRTIADGLEWSYGWTAPAAQRLRFILDFACATGRRQLRPLHSSDLNIAGPTR